MKCARDIKNLLSEYAFKIKERKILDVGCGQGDYTSLFNINGNKVYGLDIEDYRDKRYKDDFTFILYKGKRFPYSNNFFDMVISFDVIEHVEDDNLLVQEIYRVLKPDGYVFLGTPNKNRLSNILKTILGTPVIYPLVIAKDTKIGDLIHIREYVDSELTNLFIKNRFRDIYVNYFWFGLRLRFLERFSIKKPFLLKRYAQYLFIETKK